MMDNHNVIIKWYMSVSSLSLSGSGQRSRSELTYFAKAAHALNDGLHEHAQLITCIMASQLVSNNLRSQFCHFGMPS